MYYMLLTKGLKICQREKERLAFREGTIPCAERTRARHGSLRPTHSVLGRDPEMEPLMRPHSSLEAELRCQPGSWVLSHCAPSNQMPGRLSRSCHKALDPKKWWRVLFGGVASPIWGYQREGGTILRALTQSWNPGPRDQVWACMSQPRTQRGPVLALLSPTCSGLTPNGQDLCSFA